MAWDSVEDRDWGAAVLVTTRAVQGDVRRVVDVYVEDGLARALPGEAGIAGRLASACGSSVLYPGVGTTHMAVAPDGSATRAVVLEPEAEDEAWRVIAVQAPVPGLEGASVEVIDEVLHAELLPTPVADAYAARHGAGVREQVDLRTWERLVRRMQAGWPPDGRYRRDMYAEDLRARDALERSEDIVMEVAELDLIYRELTADHEYPVLDPLDCGGTVGLSGCLGWWWFRSPDPEPW
ncbi:hypothetical protein DSC45_00425 [Streptomyces sp. YIM 130001]|nr:hypothetical protein DSC45_00425 [Streptomyces sp. YIM 130001]